MISHFSRCGKVARQIARSAKSCEPKTPPLRFRSRIHRRHAPATDAPLHYNTISWLLHKCANASAVAVLNNGLDDLRRHATALTEERVKDRQGLLRIGKLALGDA